MSPAPAATDLPSVLEPLRGDLERVGARFAQILADVGDESRDLVEQAARFTGKRLRPALTCLGARAASGEVNEDVVTAAAVVELIHTATLVHDDILDGAHVRRQVPTLNSRFGEQAAVLAGDVLFSKAYRAAAWLSDPFASRYLSEVVGEVLEGEIFQDLVARSPELDEAAYRRIIRGKTAALYEAALHVGAHYAGAPLALASLLGAYGHHLGMAFQIVDDRLDLTGDERVVGKSLGRDLREGKTTLPVILWRDALGPTERKAALARIQRAWVDESEAQDLCRELSASGALARADDAAAQEIAHALAALAGLAPGPARTQLEQIAAYVLARTR